MSYIAFELDALNKVPHVALAAGIKPCEVSHGLLMLWSHCYRDKVVEVSSTHLVGFFGTAAVAPFLVAFGFLEEQGAWWRVKGASRYLRLREARSEAGKKGRQKQLEDGHSGGSRANPGKSGLLRAQASPASAEQVPSKPQALKSPPEPGQKRALSPKTESSSLREEEDSRYERPASAPEPALGGAGRGAGESSEDKAATPAPDRPPDEGESDEAFIARYPWPRVSWEPVKGYANRVLGAQARERGQKPRALREALTRERWGDRAILVEPDPEPPPGATA